MSNDNSGSQPPNFSESEDNRWRRTRRKSPQRTGYQNRPPFWKVTIIQFLRGTIGFLESAVDKLENESIDEGERNQRGFFGFTRRFLPIGVSSRISDPVLGAIAVGIIMVIAWGGGRLLITQPDQVAIAPATVNQPEQVLPETSPEISTVPSIEVPVETTQEAVVEEMPEVVPETEPERNQEQVVEEIPEAKPEPTIAVELPKPVNVPLTPEQVLIAAIENRMDEVSDRLAGGIVKSIQANFGSSTLAVKITDAWYGLKSAQQDVIATNIWLRSQELDFTHLEIFDLQDRLVARNPVVGSQIVILQRHV